jgi:hypothetical protein
MSGENTRKTQNPAVIAQQVENICAEDADISSLRNWFRSGNNVPKDFEFSYNALKNLVGFPFPETMLLEFDAFLITLAKWTPATRFSHFYSWFYRPIINGQYDGMPVVMEKVREKLKNRPLWKKIIGFYP